MALSLNDLLFNHNSGNKRGSALNLRIDYDEAIVGPEWSRLPGRLPIEQAIAYGARRVDPAMLGLFASFTWSDPRPDWIEVEAIPARPRPSDVDRRAVILRSLAQFWAVLDPGLSAYYGALEQFVADAPPLLGRIEPQRIEIGRNGQSGPVFLKLNGGVLQASPVGISEVAWRWQFRTSASPEWRDFETTFHRIFTTIDVPTEPWLQSPAEVWNSALPWSRALELACIWASGAISQAEVSTLICSAVYSLGAGVIEYGCSVGAREMYANTPMGIFDLTAFLERATGGLGNGPYVNCTDCACIVSTLANLLGAKLWQGRMGEYVPGFMLRDSQTVGHRSWGSPCGLGLGFMFHEVGWSGNCREDDQIYDASVLLDSNLSAFAHLPVPLLAAGIRFGVPWQSFYRGMLAAPNSLLLCHPRPEERRRRALI